VKQGGSIAILPDPETEEDPDLLQALQTPFVTGLESDGPIASVQSHSIIHFFKACLPNFPKRIDLPTANKHLEAHPKCRGRNTRYHGLEKPFFNALPLEQGQVFVFHVSADARIQQFDTTRPVDSIAACAWLNDRMPLPSMREKLVRSAAGRFLPMFPNGSP